MAVVDVAKGLVEQCKVGAFANAIELFYADDIVSVEPMGEFPVATGIDAIREKTKWFEANMEVHSLAVTGPYVNGDTFAVRFQLEATDKNSGHRRVMDEIGVYTVKDDKVVHEIFLFGV